MSGVMFVCVLVLQKEGDGKKLQNQPNSDASILNLSGSLKVELKDINRSSVIELVDDFLMQHSYLGGYSATQVDCRAYEALKFPPAECLPYVYRWYNHISSFGELRKSFPEVREHCHPARCLQFVLLNY